MTRFLVPTIKRSISSITQLDFINFLNCYLSLISTSVILKVSRVGYKGSFSPPNISSKCLEYHKSQTLVFTPSSVDPDNFLYLKAYCILSAIDIVPVKFPLPS